MKEKYKILFDYGAHEGFKFQDEEFDTVAEAVKHAIDLNYCTPFLIVQVINWEAKEKNPFISPEEMENVPKFQIKRRGKKHKW
jgi:hypothetical protein